MACKLLLNLSKLLNFVPQIVSLTYTFLLLLQEANLHFFFTFFRNFVSGVHEYLDGNKLAAMFALQRSLPIDFSVADVNLIRQVYNDT